MSKIKQKSIIIILLFAVISFFAFGCENKISVDDIFFKLEGDQEQIVLLVGQTLELDEFVVVQPAYASNKSYSVSSLNNAVVSANNNTITALKEGSTYIKITSSDNSKKQDMISVSVKGSVSTLDTPNNLRYDTETETFSFDAVNNAASYSININNQIVNIGNSTSFALKDYAGVQYDRTLNVKVMANAPMYSYVFKNSDYTAEYSVYQASVAKSVSVEGGVLTFVKSINSDAFIYLGDTLVATISDGTTITYSLRYINQDFAGQQKELKIETVVKNSVKEQLGNGILYNNASVNYGVITILDAPTAVLDGTVLSWNNVLGADKYEIYINNQLMVLDETNNLTFTQNNSFDLQNLTNFNSFTNVNVGSEYQIVVKALNEENSVNIASTSKYNVIKFNRLKSTLISLTGTGVEWTAVENANVYSVTIAKGETKTTFSTNSTSLDFANYPAGDYKIEVYAVANSGEEINYLSALSEDKTFTKLAYSNLSIENYTLKINGLNGENCKVKFEIDDGFIYDKVETPVDNSISIPLNYDFKIGERVIEVVRLGDGNSTINSDVHTYTFVQLAPISTISISNAKVSVGRGSTNKVENATIKLETNGVTLPDPIEYESKDKNDTNPSIQFTTINNGVDINLGAGDYQTKVYVIGDGSSTFSVRKFTKVGDDIIAELKETASLNFKVLSAPTLNFADSSKAEFTYSSIKEDDKEIANEYFIYKNGTKDASKTKSGEDFYTQAVDLDTTSLTSKSVQYKVQAIGNNKDILDSNYSSEITLTRLAAPELTFNNIYNRIFLSDSNPSGVVDENNKYTLKINDVVSNYEFSSEYKDFVVGLNKFEVVANSVLGNDGVYYLNSNPYILSLTKLDESSEFSIVNNKLEILSKVSAKYNLKLNIKFSDTSTATFITNGEVLSCDGYKDLPYSFNNKKYTITLIDSEYNALINKFNNDFTVNVQYIQPSTGADTIVNSDISEDSSTLNLVDIEPTSTIEINEKNQLVITPENHTQELGIWVTFKVGATEYEFKPNGEYGLVYDDKVLPYQYKTGSYYVTLINEEYNAIFAELKSSFNAKVKYSYNKVGEITDLDSVYSEQSEALELIHIDEVSTFTINENNQLLITPENHTQELGIWVTYKIAGIEYEFRPNGENQLVYEDKVLPYEYKSGAYYVNLINENFNAIFSLLTSPFTVKVKYSYNKAGNVTDLDSVYSDESEEISLIKISNVAKFEVNTDNQLVITPTEHSKEYFLIVTFKVGGTNYEFSSNAEQTKLIYSSIELPYEYKSSKYYIQLLNSSYEPLFEELTSNFNVTVKYTHLTQLSDVDSDYSLDKVITILNAVTITRDGQNIKLNNVVSSYTCEHYSVIINDTNKVDLTSIGNKVNNDIIVPFESIYSWVDGEIYTISALTKNIETSEETPLLTKKGVTIKVAKQQTVILTSVKDNHATNNSAVVSFTTFEQSCKLSYVVTISNGKDADVTKQYDSLANEAIKTNSFYLDEITLEGPLSITACVLANAKTADDVEMFNSKTSNTLDFNKVLAPTGIYVSDSTLHFEAINNAVGYELWENLGTGYRFYAGLIESNSYDVSNWTGEKSLVLKTISKVGYTNSNYSSEFTINKLASPVVNNLGGRLYVSISSEVVELVKQDVLVTLNIIKNNGTITNVEFAYDGENDKLTLNNSISGISLSGTTLVIQGHAVLTNSSDTIVGENLKFKYVVNYEDDSLEYYYCNSNQTEIVVYGLFAPIEVEKTTIENNSLEMLVWKENTSNVITKIEDGETKIIPFSLAYEFVITYVDGEGNEYTYSSTNKNLKYYDAQNALQSYPTKITTKQVIFPAGFFDGENDVVFGVGTYSVIVRTIPNAEYDEYKLLSSKYSSVSTFTIMAEPVATINNGIIEWEKIANATSYLVNIYEINSSIIKEYAVVANNSFDLSTINTTGLIDIEVKAISNREDTLNSAFSTKISAYRLPKANSVYVDDGNLILQANKYFSYANITFTSSSTSFTYPYINPNYRQNLEALKEDYENASWFELISILNSLDTPDKYVIDLNEEAMKIISGNNYTITVQLMGNSSGSVGILNSQIASNLSLLSFAKLTTTETTVNMGVINFSASSSYTNKDLNYVFNGEADGSTFWNNTIVYKINLTTGGKIVELYAVDYDTFNIHKNKLDSSDIIEYNLSDLCAAIKYTNSKGTIIFNVFKDNIINLRDYNYFYYYETTSATDKGVTTLTTSLDSENGYKRLDLNQSSSYVIDIYMLGGDSKNNLGYVTSGNCDLSLFVRYGNFVDGEGNSTLSTENGKISMPDLRQYKTVDVGEGGQTQIVVDNPVYRLKVKGGTETKTVYLYYTTEEDARIVASRLDVNYLNAIYAPLEFSEVYEKIVLFNFSEYFSAGNYTINTRVLAGVGNGSSDAQHYLINSIEVTDEKPYSMYSDVEFTISKGLLKLDLSYIKVDGVPSAYSRKYEITINIDSVDYTYVITEASDGVTIFDNALYYNMPRRLSFVVDGKTQNKYINSNKIYSVKVRALSENNYLNGAYSNALEFTKSANAENVKINNGRLEYIVQDLTTYTGINIKVEINSVTYIIENISGTAVYDEGGNYLYHYYQFKDNEYDLGSNNLTISNVNAGGDVNEYSISISVVSKNNIINSDYVSISGKVIRLAGVDTSSIKSNNGVIAWNAVADAVSYIIEVGEYVYSTTSTSLDVTTILAKNGRVLPAGENYIVYITAIGGDKLTSVKVVADYKFNKLDTIEQSSIRISSNKVIWDEVANATGYNVIFTYTNTSGETATVNSFVEFASFDAPNDINGKFTIEIQVVGGEVEGKQYLNSVYSQGWTSSSNNPNPIQTLNYNDELFRFEWNVSEDFEDSDKLEIVYDLVEYEKDGSNEDVESQQLTYKMVKDIEPYYDSENKIYYINKMNFYDSENNIYFFNLEKIGKYSNFTVRVLRDGTVPSSSIVYEDEQGNKTKQFTIYSYGEGTETNPYRIYNAEQLLNIKHFATKQTHFKLTNNISVKDAITDYSTISDYIIAEEFNGVLDGDGKNIGDFTEVENGVQTINLTNSSSFALFGTLNNANITNIYLGNSTSLVKIINLFDENNSNMLQLSLIATGVENSIISNVRLYEFEIIIDGLSAVTLSGGVRIAGLVASANNSTISDININRLNVEISANINVSNKNESSYIAGVVAVAETTNVNNVAVKSTVGENTVGFKLDVKNSNNTITYFGGIVAYYTGNATLDYSISATVFINIANVKSTNIGGIVGYASNVQITSASVTGTIAYEYATHSLRVGGIAGTLRNFNISAATIDVEFNFTGLIGTNSDQYLGSVAGSLEDSGTVSNWHYDSNNVAITTIIDETITIGCCGRKDSNVTINQEN